MISQRKMLATKKFKSPIFTFERRKKKPKEIKFYAPKTHCMKLHV